MFLREKPGCSTHLLWPEVAEGVVLLWGLEGRGEPGVTMRTQAPSLDRRHRPGLGRGWPGSGVVGQALWAARLVPVQEVPGPGLPRAPSLVATREKAEGGPPRARQQAGPEGWEKGIQNRLGLLLPMSFQNHKTCPHSNKWGCACSGLRSVDIPFLQRKRGHESSAQQTDLLLHREGVGWGRNELAGRPRTQAHVCTREGEQTW